MDNPRPEKVAVVTEVRERFDAADAAILTEYRGIDVTAMADLRGSIRAAGGDYKIYKNTLVRLAVSQLQLELEDLLVGPTAIAFVAPTDEGRAGDPAAVAKALREFAKKNENLIVKGGILGDRVVSAADLLALADLPPREQLLSEFAGAMESILGEFAGVLDAKLREMAYAMQELLDKGGPSGDAGAGEAVAEPDAEQPVATDSADSADTEPPAEANETEPAAGDEPVAEITETEPTTEESSEEA